MKKPQFSVFLSGTESMISPARSCFLLCAGSVLIRKNVPSSFVGKCTPIPDMYLYSTNYSALNCPCESVDRQTKGGEREDLDQVGEENQESRRLQFRKEGDYFEI